MTQSRMSLRLKHPAAHQILGSSQSGKSFYLYNYLRNLKSLYNPNINFKTIYWFYGEKDAIKNIPLDVKTKLTLVDGIPINFSSLFNCPKPAIFIFDDLFSQIFIRPEIVNLILNSVHHCDITCILTSQVAFPKEKNARTLSLNSHYIVFLPSPRMNASFSHLTSQIAEPEDRKALLDAYRDSIATSGPRTPFILDLHPATANWARYRTHIFPSNDCTIIYCPKRFYNDCISSPETTIFNHS
jgi:hypothetical protein